MKKEIIDYEESSDSSEDGYLAKTKSKAKKGLPRSVSADLYYKGDFVKKNLNINRTKSAKKEPPVPRKDRFGNSFNANSAKSLKSFKS
jgi:hypothetical protein